MTTASTSKNERQHQRVKDSSKGRGASKKRTKGVAARTVKARRAQSHTASKRSPVTGEPSHILEDQSREELYDMARKRHIPWRCSMSKGQLINALLGRRY